jgi:chemotaxis protein methyltransferase CheR
VTSGEYEYLCCFLKERSGLALLPQKQYLLESRLMPVVRRMGIADIGELVRRLRAPDAEPLRVAVTEAMTINESFFFRDKIPFERFTDTMLPALLAARTAQRRIRVWCSAAASGQEPYSLAMLVREASDQLAGWRVEILATDIGAEVLDRARAGIYTQFEVQRGLPIQSLIRYFDQEGEQWRIKEELRRMVQFRLLNLLDDFSRLGVFDVIFCRNVLIYFDNATKTAVLERLARALACDGYLVLGAAETVVGLTDAFVPHPEKRGVYVRNAQLEARARLTSAIGGARVA